jgi:MFS family permease
LSTAGTAVRETTDSLRTVFRNPGLRRVNLALAGSLIGDWAYATALTVWVYGVGGATAVGVWGVVRLSLLAVVTPFASALADRYPRKIVMVSADVTRGVLVLIAASVVYWNGPNAVVFLAGTLAAVCAAPFRPAQMALMPSLVDEPKELTAANGTASTLESLAFFVGPAIGGLLLTVADIPLVFVLNAVTFFWSAALVIGVHPHAAVTADVSTEDGDEEPTENFWRESVAGFHTIWVNADLRMVTGMYCAQTVVAGASLVFGIAVAVDFVGRGPQGVGYLDAVLGIGAIFGGLLAIARGSKHRLATDFGIGVVFWALPLLLISVWPAAVPAFAAMFVIGAANPVVDVNAATILQRLAPDAVLGRVFGALETGLIATMALGALIMPLLISTIGLRWGLAVLAVGITLIVVPGFSRLRRLDESLRPPAGLELLEKIALFAPLDRPTLEGLARRLTSVTVPAGAVVIAEGDVGDNFYVIESGAVRVTQQGRELRTETAGEFFGEIALIRNVLRTATVTATEATVLWALGRDDFLAALNGSNEARSSAEEIVSRRLPTV